MVIIATVMYAQGGTKSPYSQFGVGVLSEQSQSMSRGMNGVGIGMRIGNQVNTLNPASYSGVDSLTMLIDAGMAIQLTNFKEGSVRQNAKLADFEYLTASFRAWRNVGMAVGVVPFTNVGYDYSTATYLDESNGYFTESYSGSGGLHQAFFGVGVRLFSPLSVGVNMSYLWGDIKRSAVSGGSSTINTLSKQYSVSVSNYKLDAGIQWDQRIGKRDRLVLGVTYGMPHKLNADPDMLLINKNALSGKTDTTSFTINNGIELPLMLGAGLSYNHDQRLIVAADATFQRWGSVSEPHFDAFSNKYVMKSGFYKNRYKGSLGVQWAPNPASHNFFKRICYRLGGGYATPYYKINGKNGPSELTASIGLGIPIINVYNNRSMLHISGQWVQNSATGMIKENTFRINIGLTFNERWFAKMRVE